MIACVSMEPVPGPGRSSGNLRLRGLACVLMGCLLWAGCRRDMYDQPRSKPAGESPFFRDGADSRPLPPHTVAVGHGATNEAFYSGLQGSNLVEELPVPLTPA